MTVVTEEAQAVIGEAIDNLAQNMAKLMNGLGNVSPRSAYVAAWCKMHPEEVRDIVGTMAMLYAQQINFKRKAGS